MIAFTASLGGPIRGDRVLLFVSPIRIRNYGWNTFGLGIRKEMSRRLLN